MAGGRFVVLVSAVVLAGSAVASEPAMWNWGDATNAYIDDSAFAESKAICRRLRALTVPAAAGPTSSQAAALKGCDSQALYYGEGAPPDYIKARQCAVLEDRNGDGGPFVGKAILMQIYANGYGTARNLDLATALACEIEGAPFENDGRVRHIQSLTADLDPFDFCDDITSGVAGGQCAARVSVGAGVERNRKIDAVIHRLPAASLPLFAGVKTSFDAFAEAHSGYEIDMSGSAHAAFFIEERDRESDQFLKDLTRLADDQWPRASQAAAIASDAALNESYRNALKICTDDESNASTVRAENVRITQRAWLSYRDAYMAFAKIAAPAVSQDAVLARLTNLRIAELDHLPCGV